MWPWLAAATSALLAAPAGAAPATQALTIYSNPDDGVSIEAIGWLGLSEVCPVVGSGLIPLQIRVVNGSSRDVIVATRGAERRWSMGNGTVIPRTTILAPAGETTSRTVFFEPVAWDDYQASQIPSVMLSAGGAGRRFEVEVGVMMRQTTTTGFGPGGMTPDPPAPPTAQPATAPRVYSAAALRLLRPEGAPWPSLGGIAEGEIDINAAPDDWRGFTALREIVIGDDDWTTMPSGTRRALLAWVGLGGLVRVVAADGDAGRIDRLGLPRAGADGRRRVGAGEVMVVPPGEETWNALHGGGGPAADATPPLEQSGSPVGSYRFSERTLPFTPILAFLALFAILAGPVNVMLIAGKGRPSRIFWTTPVLALLATVILLALMFVRDGVGGDGNRVTLALLDPERSTALVLQQQVSRTGVLLGRSMPIRETSWMSPVPGAVGAAPAMGVMSRGALDFEEVEGARRSGDWFRSRSDQAFTLQAVRSSRGRLVVTGPPEAPEIVSSIDVPLARVLVVDTDGRPWRCDALGAGERRSLAPATEADVDALRRELFTGPGNRIRMAIDRLCGAPGIAWAEAAEPAGVAISTLDAIRWNDDRAWFVSPLGSEEAP